MLSGVVDEDEFNLQFLRSNLRALINTCEKLHATVGAMRDLMFISERVGKHPFFHSVRIPIRRYAKELTAAQVLLQAFSVRESNSDELTRARHFDLQRFVRKHATIATDHPVTGEIALTLNSLEEGAEPATGYLRKRAFTVSFVILAWENGRSVRVFARGTVLGVR